MSTTAMTESDVRDGVAYVRAYLGGDTDAMGVLSRYGNSTAMLTAVSAIFAAHLVDVFAGQPARATAWLDAILTETVAA